MNPIKYNAPRMMKSVLVVNILASKIEKIPAQPQPVRVTACIVETEVSLKYLLSNDGRPEKLPP